EDLEERVEGDERHEAGQDKGRDQPDRPAPDGAPRRGTGRATPTRGDPERRRGEDERDREEADEDPADVAHVLALLLVEDGRAGDLDREVGRADDEVVEDRA